MSGVLTFGEVLNGDLTSASLEVAAVGRELAEQLGVAFEGALIGTGLDAGVADLLAAGMTRLFVADGAGFEPYASESYVAAATAIIDQCSATIVLFPHSANTREWVPRLAARRGAGLITDCTGVELNDSQLVMTKPIFGGSVLAECVATTPIVMATLRGGAFEGVPATVQGEIVAVSSPSPSSRVTVLEEVAEVSSEGPRLKTARTVVSGGLGVGGPENWHLVEDVANALGAAVGATRAVTDLNWVPSHHQVGLTGTNVAPELYIAIGVSGAIQHMAGISQAKTIVAINRDPDANIFSVARYGAVGDAKEIVPAFVERLRELQG